MERPIRMSPRGFKGTADWGRLESVLPMNLWGNVPGGSPSMIPPVQAEVPGPGAVPAKLSLRMSEGFNACPLPDLVLQRAWRKGKPYDVFERFAFTLCHKARVARVGTQSMKLLQPSMLTATGWRRGVGSIIDEVMFAVIACQAPAPGLSAAYARPAGLAAIMRWDGLGAIRFGPLAGGVRLGLRRFRSSVHH